MPQRVAGIVLLTVVVTGTTAIVAARAQAGGDQSRASAMTVHEWGTFTSIAGESGQAVQWNPLDRPSDLPCFVTLLNPTSIKAEAHMTRSRVRETDTGTTASTCGALNTSSISNLASAMWASLCLRSFSRQRRSSLRTGSGVVWGNAFQSGSLSSIAASVSEIVSPANGGRPVSIS